MTDEDRVVAGLCLFELDLVDTRIALRVDNADSVTHDRDQIVDILARMLKPVYCKHDRSRRGLIVSSTFAEALHEHYEQRLQLLTGQDGIIGVIKREYPRSIVRIVRNGAEYHVSPLELELFVGSYVLGSSNSWTVPNWPAANSPVVLASGTPKRLTSVT
jgi:hypothetical protein